MPDPTLVVAKSPASGPRASRRVVARAAAVGIGGAIALTAVVLLQVRDRPLAVLIQPGADGPARTVVARDFPALQLPSGAGNDGQLFYTIARDPLHPSHTAKYLDRPRYRLQRLVYPVLAWAVHPSGGGDGLVAALLGVNALAAALAAGALAWWAQRQRRSALWGLAAIALPGAYVAMRISCADVLAGGLALLAAVLLLEGYSGAAVFAAVGAVLTKESMLILLAAVALSALLAGARRRALLAFIVAPAAAAALLWGALLLAFPHAGRQYMETGMPLRGLLDSVQYWRGSGDWKPAATVTVTVAIAVLALRRPARGAFTYAIAGYLALAAVQAMGTLAFWTSAPRTLYPLGLCSVAGLLERPGIGSLGECRRRRQRSSATIPGVPLAAEASSDGRAPTGRATGANAARGSAQHALQ